MSQFHTPSPSDFDRWEQLIAQGDDPSQAAKQLGFGGSSSFKRADRARHAEALEWWRTNTRQADVEYVRNNLVVNVETARLAGDLPASNKALELIGKHAGMFDDHLEIEHTGEVGVVVDHDIEGILGTLRSIGAVSERTGDAADTETIEVLPALPDAATVGRSRRAPAAAA